MSTTGLRQWYILDCLQDDYAQPECREQDVASGTEKVTEKRMHAKMFLDGIPKMPSHYCRKETTKLYLEPFFRKYSDLYNEYLADCKRKDKPSMSRTAFMEEVESKNIAIFKPRKDMCDICFAYEKGNLEESKYEAHRKKKRAAQDEKERDKEAAKSEKGLLVLCMDVQRVLLAPFLQASALYYKTKLQVHNFSVYDLSSRDATCYVWNESEGGMTASEFASCLIDFLKQQDFTKCIIFSDGCTYQNRNAVLATALRHFCATEGKTVEQKYLEKGHTQMEVDSVHATIENKLRGAAIIRHLTM